MRVRFFLCLALIYISQIASAKIRLPEIVGDGMVLQQSTKARIWGWSDPGSVVEVKVSWGEKKYSVKALADSTWEVALETPAADLREHEIEISSGREKLLIGRVLIGEVWFCSGQSNMQMPLNGFQNQPVENANRYILESGLYKYVRVATIPNVKALIPQKEVAGKWKVSTPGNAPWFGAVSYLYGIQLFRVLNVPIGIINCSWGGSRVEGWLPEWKLKKYPDVSPDEAVDPKVKEYLRPMIMYNGMLKPLQRYTIKGFLWYQGESNVNSWQSYSQRLAEMVALWREEWGLGELPFYFVEIAPYNKYGTSDQGAFLREQQALAQHIIPSSSMVATGDLVKPFEHNCIHPSNKATVAERLAQTALAATYGIAGIWYKSPEYDKIELKGDEAVLYFKYAPDGFTPFENIEGFEVSGDDMVFYPAKAYASMKDKNIYVSSDKVKQIAAVRFCFHNLDTVKLYNTRGLPVIPFRTDKW